MFLKQYNYKPRSGSQSGAAANEPSQVAQQAQAAAANAQSSATSAQSRRRSSTDQQFAGLTGYKRTSQDAKRSSFSEQNAQQPGVLGQMWNSFTKGS